MEVRSYFAVRLSSQLSIWHLSEWNVVRMSCPMSKMDEHLSGLNISVACMQCVNSVWCGSYWKFGYSAGEMYLKSYPDGVASLKSIVVNKLL